MNENNLVNKQRRLNGLEQDVLCIAYLKAEIAAEEKLLKVQLYQIADYIHSKHCIKWYDRSCDWHTHQPTGSEPGKIRFDSTVSYYRLATDIMEAIDTGMPISDKYPTPEGL